MTQNSAHKMLNPYTGEGPRQASSSSQGLCDKGSGRSSASLGKFDGSREQKWKLFAEFFVGMVQQDERSFTLHDEAAEASSLRDVGLEQGAAWQQRQPQHLSQQGAASSSKDCDSAEGSNERIVGDAAHCQQRGAKKAPGPRGTHGPHEPDDAAGGEVDVAGAGTEAGAGGNKQGMHLRRRTNMRFYWTWAKRFLIFKAIALLLR